MEFNKHPAEVLLGHPLDSAIGVQVVNLDRLVNRLWEAALNLRNREVNAAEQRAADEVGTMFVTLTGTCNHESSMPDWATAEPWERELVCRTGAETGVCTCPRTGQAYHPEVKKARAQAQQKWDQILRGGNVLEKVASFLRYDRRETPFRRFWAGWQSLTRRSDRNIVGILSEIDNHLGLDIVEERLYHTLPGDPRRAAWVWGVFSTHWDFQEPSMDPRDQREPGRVRVEVGVFNREQTELTVFVSSGLASVLHEIVGCWA